MRFSLGIRRTSRNGLRIGPLPDYDLEGWDCQSSSPNALVYLPTGEAFLWNVIALVVPSIVIASLLWTVDPPWKWGNVSSPVSESPSGEREATESPLAGMDELFRSDLADELRSHLSEERLAELDRERQERVKERKAHEVRIRAVGLLIGTLCWMVLLPVIVLLGWIALRFGLYDLLRYPFDRLEIRCLESKVLEIRRAGLRRAATSQWKLDELSHLAVRVQEEASRHPHHHHGWVWCVDLVPLGMSDDVRIRFFVERLRSPPGDKMSPPGKTRQFLQDLQQMTALPRG
jgi:hypothetical protein